MSIKLRNNTASPKGPFADTMPPSYLFIIRKELQESTKEGGGFRKNGEDALGFS